MIQEKCLVYLKEGILNLAEFLPSPNCEDREGDQIDLLVIHNISLPPGEFGGEDVANFFLNKLDFSAHPFYEQLVDLKVSSHLFISREGIIKQFVPFHLRAWHAGESFYKGRAKCNDFSIGIELEGTDHIPYATIQYHRLAVVTKHLIKCYPGITFDRIVGHDTIAPARKTDPGPAFDWHYFKSLLKKEWVE
jgi:AmpD protein